MLTVITLNGSERATQFNPCNLQTARQVVHKQPATKVIVVACTRGHAYTCACKFRLNVQNPAITTTLPVCRCRHRDETARDSGPGTSDKPGFHSTNKQHGARTTTTRLQQNGPRSRAQDGQRTPISGECRDKRTRRNIRSVHSRCRILQPPHAYPKRAGNPGQPRLDDSRPNSNEPRRREQP